MSVPAKTKAPPPAKQQNGAAAVDPKFFTLLDQSRGEIAKLLPEHVSLDRVLRVARTTYQMKPEIRNCTPVSILAAVMKAAELGLEPGGARKHGWMIAYGNVCEFQVGYQGMLELARRSKEFRVIEAVIVNEADRFSLIRDPSAKILHEPYLRGDAGPMIGVYAYAKLASGEPVFEYMTRKEVDKCRACSKAPNSPAWRNWYEQMGCRSVLNRLLKRQPQSVELAEALEHVSHEFLDDPDSGNVRVRTSGRSRRTDQLADQLEAHALEAPEPSFTEGTPGRVVSEPPEPEVAQDDEPLEESREPGSDG